MTTVDDAPILTSSGLDSDRFALRVHRATVAALDERALLKEMLDKETDVAIVRVPAGQGGGFQRLGRFGMHPLHADTLVVYQLSLGDYEPVALRNQDLVITEATPGDVPEINALVASTFASYLSHYHANPWFEPEQILAGYAQWASSYVSGTGDDRVTWVARRGGVMVAFACCRHDPNARECEGVLYGVHPDHSGGGLYGDLIRFTQASYRQRGYRTMKVSTQIWNLAVQKVWAREGFALGQAFDTFHINAMLSAGDVLVDRELVFSAEQVMQFAACSGDFNAIHFDDAAARASGFESRITHGMLAGAELSRIFGTEVPGVGTLFLRSESIFLAPIYPSQPHGLRIRYLRNSRSSGYVLAVATIRDRSGRLCLLAYNDLLNRL